MSYADDKYGEYDDYKYRDYIPKFELVQKTHPLFDPEKTWDFINQKKIWIDKEFNEIKIKGMDKHYLFNVLKWADKKANDIEFTLEMGEQISKVPESFIFFSLGELPLFVKIKERYIKLAQTP